MCLLQVSVLMKKKIPFCVGDLNRILQSPSAPFRNHSAHSGMFRDSCTISPSLLESWWGLGPKFQSKDQLWALASMHTFFFVALKKTIAQLFRNGLESAVRRATHQRTFEGQGFFSQPSSVFPFQFSLDSNYCSCASLQELQPLGYAEHKKKQKKNVVHRSVFT